MKCILFNGSPRAKKSNSHFLMKSFQEGFDANSDTPMELHYLRERETGKYFQEALLNCDVALFVFPLYADSMPALVLDYFLQMEEISQTRPLPALGFIVHSGFPETIHSRPVERYLKRMTQKLRVRYAGCVIKGGSEGIQDMPRYMTSKLLQRFFLLGESFAREGQLSETIAKKLAGTEKYSPFTALFILPLAFQMSKAFWNAQLKKNNAYDLRFQRPYENP